MLDTIRDFFSKQLLPAAGARGEGRAVEIAAAALIAEMVRMDGEVEEAEREAVLRAVRTKFGLSAEDAETLIGLAEQEARNATDYYQFTSLINRHFSNQQKVRLVECLWQVAYADAELSVYEDHLVRKIANLLYLSHREFIAAKLRARDAAGRPPSR